MKHGLWVIPLLAVSPLFAKGNKLRGYVLDPAAFRSIQTYCVDTHNLPAREVKVIDQFMSRESRPHRLLSQLPWRRLASCKEGAPDARVRLEFPPDRLPVQLLRHDVNGMLFVFKSGSPSPIYETREVLMPGFPDGDNDRCAVVFLESGAVGIVVRALIHDWRQFSAPAAPSGGSGAERGSVRPAETLFLRAGGHPRSVQAITGP
jgi:hypothetical protein